MLVAALADAAGHVGLVGPLRVATLYQASLKKCPRSVVLGSEAGHVELCVVFCAECALRGSLSDA